LAAFVVLWTAFALRCFLRRGLQLASLLQCRGPTQIAVPRLPLSAFKGSLAQTLITVVSAVIGIAALAGGVQNWLLIQANRAERPMLIAAGLLLVYPGVVTDGAGLVLIVAVVLMQNLRSR
jgi:TRAP-type uncharacterized transport system fused permease subunit